MNKQTNKNKNKKQKKKQQQQQNCYVRSKTSTKKSAILKVF